MKNNLMNKTIEINTKFLIVRIDDSLILSLLPVAAADASRNITNVLSSPVLVSTPRSSFHSALTVCPAVGDTTPVVNPFHLVAESND